jgi:hypothetical protein
MREASMRTRMTSPSAWAVVKLAAVVALGSWAAAGEPSEVRIGPGTGTARGPLDWVFEKVESRNDAWESETVHDEIGARLKLLAERIAALDFSAEALRGFLAPGFRSGDPALEPWTTVHAARGLEVVHGAPPGGAVPRAMEAGDFAGVLRTCFRAWETGLKAKFKVFRLLPGAGERPGGRSTVLLEADGTLGARGFVQVRAVWEIDWARGEDGWRIAELRPLSFERASLLERPFTEVTTPALGENPSYGGQLLVGLDAWRTRLDAACGIDIYGHQGVSVGDFDGDGWEDIYVPQPAGLPNRLYRNRGDGTFEDVTDGAGVGVLDTTGGALFADLDGDADQDLIVVTPLEVLAFENGGKGRFERRAGTGLEKAGEEGASSMGVAAADYDRDGDLDLYVFCYIFWAGAGTKTHTSYPYPYHDANNGAPNYLLRNDGGWRFTDVTAASGMGENNRRFSLAASWCDYDDDGDPDLYVANDFGRNNLYRNEGDGMFRDVAAEAGVEDIGNGMSVAWEDYDADGRMDLYVGNMWSSAGNRLVDQPAFRKASAGVQDVYRRMARGNSLFRNLGDGRFEDVSEESGTTFGRWAWSSMFIDHDSDGREDIYVANGFVTNESQDDL